MHFMVCNMHALHTPNPTQGIYSAYICTHKNYFWRINGTCNKICAIDTHCHEIVLVNKTFQAYSPTLISLMTKVLLQLNCRSLNRKTIALCNPTLDIRPGQSIFIYLFIYFFCTQCHKHRLAASNQSLLYDWLPAHLLSSRLLQLPRPGLLQDNSFTVSFVCFITTRFCFGIIFGTIRARFGA